MLSFFISTSYAEIPLGSPPPIKGIALGLFSKEAGFSYAQDLKEIKALGATHVLLLVSWYQKDIFDNEIKALPWDEKDSMSIPDQDLIQVIRDAHQNKLKVMLFPIIRFLERKPGQWRGVLQPKDYTIWKTSYQNFITHYAMIAKKEKVAIFSVGSELGKMEKDLAFWTETIQKVKAIYSGKLIYSVNWDHYEHPVFWDQLDYIGMTSYYELTKSYHPKYDDLINAWRALRHKILKWKSQYKQPLIFTEIGYPSIDGANIYPWNYFAEKSVDLEEQALCYRSFARAWGDSPELGGLFWWVWWGEGGSQDKSYTPRGKPAAQVIQEWFNQ